jgi:hypothetical protein
MADLERQSGGAAEGREGETGPKTDRFRTPELQETPGRAADERLLGGPSNTSNDEWAMQATGPEEDSPPALEAMPEAERVAGFRAKVAFDKSGSYLMEDNVCRNA